MRILLSAFACAPNIGSEAGVGWRWALELSKQHDVWVLTDITRKVLIEPELVKLDRPRLHVVYFRPGWLKNMPLNSRTAQMLFTLWQFAVVPFAKALHRQHQFDYVHHLTYGVFRHPSLLWKLGAPFVFGPVGGGERAPLRLRQSMSFKGKCVEFARDVINTIARFDPFLRRSLHEADIIFARTRETRQALPRFARKKTLLQQEIGGYPARRLPEQIAVRQARPFKLLFAGRLLEWKGVPLAMRAFAGLLAAQPDAQFTIVGSGPMKARLVALAAELGVDGNVRFVDQVMQSELFAMYADFDCLLFPSLHDSGGNVVLEALSFGLPVVCLDLGGPPTFVNEQCGRVVPVDHRSEADIVVAMTRELVDLATSPQKVHALALGALCRAEDITWEKQIAATMQAIGHATGVK